MRLTASFVVLLIFTSLAAAQPPGGAQRQREQKPASPATNQTAPPQDAVETLKIDTNLVTVPVIASSRAGAYISDLRKEEFKLWEDGVSQDIAFLATVNAPFHLVLLLDTSASTEEKLGQIQQAAISFVGLLSSADKVKVVSFDNEVRDLSDFTGDKAVLRAAILEARSGTGTRVYDALQFSLNALRPTTQRKAIVAFTDGVDWHSETSTYESTIRELEESGVIVYPIRFDTRVESERIARQQQGEENGVQLPTSSVIRQPNSGTTPTTFPGEDTSPVPTRKRPPLPGIPSPTVIFGRREPTLDPNADPFPEDPTRRAPPPVPRPTSPRHDSLTAQLDQLYLMADSYLKQVAEGTGGQVYRADTVSVLPRAFAAIAAELRTQYLLGYYPTNRTPDGVYRKVQVKTSRQDISIRARPGYRPRRG
jgi:VWFA-related protein